MYLGTEGNDAGMKKKVVVIAVVTVLLVSAVAVAVYTVQKSRHNILDGCYADVSDAEYMAACLSNGFSASSTAESMRDYYMDSYDTCSLYKINHEGTIDMPDVAILSSINVVNGKVYVSGISQSGQVSTVKVNPDGTAESSLSEMELRTYIMLPIA